MCFVKWYHFKHRVLNIIKDYSSKIYQDQNKQSTVHVQKSVHFNTFIHKVYNLLFSNNENFILQNLKKLTLYTFSVLCFFFRKNVTNVKTKQEHHSSKSLSNMTYNTFCFRMYARKTPIKNSYKSEYLN